MRRHLSFRSVNPALNKNTFKVLNRNGAIGPISKNDSMTIKGTVDKTAISLFIMIASGYYIYSEQIVSLTIPGCILGFIVAIFTIFKKQYAPFTVPLYALFQGLFLGGISFMYGQMFEGIVYNAVLLTVTILLSLLLAYRSGIIKATENFKLGVFAATGGIALFYLISF